jgi:hypothetical protein
MDDIVDSPMTALVLIEGGGSKRGVGHGIASFESSFGDLRSCSMLLSDV